MDAAIAHPVNPTSQPSSPSDTTTNMVSSSDTTSSVEEQAAFSTSNLEEREPSQLSSLQPTTNKESSRWGEPHTGNSTSTDSRGSCPGVTSPLVALIPDNNIGRFVSDNPTLWFYVPYNSEMISRGMFLLQDQEDNDVIDPLEFTVSNTPGFVSVSLPPLSPSLKANGDYHWYFELYCDDGNASPVYVDGWLEKATLDDDSVSSDQFSASDLPASLSSTDYFLYRQKYIWFDAVDALLQEWSTSPEDEALREELLNLLQSANVELNAWPEDAGVTSIQYN